MASNQQELAVAAAAGSAAAFAALIADAYDSIYTIAYRFIGSRDDAEDIAQNVCAKLATAIRAFRGEAAFSTWLYRLAVNAAIDHLRTRPVQDAMDTSEGALDACASADLSPEGHMFNRDLWRAVHRLPPQQRDAVLLVYGEDLSHQETAAALGCAEATISWHLHEARKALKRNLQAAE